MLFQLIGKIFLVIYNWTIRIKAKIFSIMISGAFAKFGDKSVIMPPVRLSGVKQIEIGNQVYIGPNSWLQTLSDSKNESTCIFIGSGTSIVGSCVISAVRQVVIENDVLIARNVYISDHMHRYKDEMFPIMSQGLDKIKPVLIRKGSWIGNNVVICPGVTIGCGAVIGANSVVNRDVPDFSVAVGSPARVVKKIAVHS